MGRSLFLLILTLHAVSCAKVLTDDGESRILIDASIEESASVKSILTGTKFKDGSSIGLFVYLAEAVDPPVQLDIYGDKYRNIRAKTDTYGKWTYRFEGSGTWFDNIYLIKPVATDKGLTICAYSPWVDGAGSIADIPFSLGGAAADVSDLMWAEQNSNGVNARIIPDGNDKTVSLSFRHALAQIRCCFKCVHDDTEMAVSSITLARKDGGETPLYVGGTFNALDGTFPVKTEGASFTTEYKNIYFDSSDYSDLSTASLLLVPVDEYQSSGDYVLKFRFDGQGLSSEYPISRDDIRTGTDGAYSYSFEAGKTYTFYFKFNNFVQLDNVVVSDDWTDGGDINLEF